MIYFTLLDHTLPPHSAAACGATVRNVACQYHSLYAITTRQSFLIAYYYNLNLIAFIGRAKLTMGNKSLI
jgi:hypothetical protein